jgi:hypothetical protein
VLALANVGIVACSSSTEQNGWHKQEKFAAQCQRLANRAVWWQFLRKHQIEFDSRRFDDDIKKLDGSNKERDPPASSYALSLVNPIIVKLLSTEYGGSVQSIVQVLAKYAETFGLQRDNVIELYIEYLLTPPPKDAAADTRLNLSGIELSVRSLLPLVQPILRRASTLRRVVVALERDEDSSRDYDRHSLVLSLYREVLHQVMEVHPIVQKLDPVLFEAELEAVDRRRDALAILSSVFEGERKCGRPPFPAFFKPLPLKFKDHSNDNDHFAVCGILGNLDPNYSESFDPLNPLQDVLLSSFDTNASMALAPLCLPLGLPNGYIHARFLMEYLQLAAKQNSRLPTFDNDISSVLNRIHSSGDKAALAEWCSSFFMKNDQERLKCLEFALSCAIKFSSEVEQRKNRLSSKCRDNSLATIMQEEKRALERVERLSRAKSSLSDKITVVTSLGFGDTTVDKSSSVARVAKALSERLEQVVWRNNLSPQPDQVVEVLLSEGSLLAANHCLDATSPFSIQQFQQLLKLCNEACQNLSDNHSHIHTGLIARTMVRGWLFQGDDLNSNEVEKQLERGDASAITVKLSKTTPPAALDDLKEEDTINFVMDLSSIQEEDQFGSTEMESRGASPKEINVTSDEEPSALRKSAREISEEMAKRVALRVAFVMACDATARQDTPSWEGNAPNNPDENSRSAANLTVGARDKGRTSKPAGGLLARIEKGGAKQNAMVLECAKDLLQIVFAKSEVHCDSRILVESGRNMTKTVTFSMRHRALRAASILCPQEALEKVIRDEGYLNTESPDLECSLKKCAFGAFVAKEAELIGLPLSHSDLGHISSMHFLSYARTMWRFHRDGNLKGSQGRLLLLLLEMSLKDDSQTDAAFVELILKEMGRLYLPRSLLLACECITMKDEADSRNKNASSLRSTCADAFNAAIVISAKAILSQLFESVRAGSFDQTHLQDAVSTVRRLGQVVQAVCDCPDGQAHLCHFVSVLVDVAIMNSGSSGNQLLAQGLADGILNAMRHLQDSEHRKKLISKLTSIPGSHEIFGQLALH